jgi:hypothetical protein
MKTKIWIGNILICPSNDEIFQRTIIIDGYPTTIYSKNKESLLINEELK